MAKNGFSWSNERDPVSHGSSANSETNKALTKQIVNLIQQMAELSMVNSTSSSNATANLYDPCGVPGHCLINCPQVYKEENALNAKQPGGPYSNKYNAGDKNHPNLSHSSTNVLNPPPPFNIRLYTSSTLNKLNLVLSPRLHYYKSSLVPQIMPQKFKICDKF